MGEFKYPVKWGIKYRDKTLVVTNGKKKAYDLLYNLSNCVHGLVVVPIIPEKKVVSSSEERNRSRDYYKRWVANNREKVRAYQREYQMKKRGKIKE